MSVKLKICGLTTLADARYCAGAGADFLGFVFHRPSPRYIEPEGVRQIADWLHGPDLVGVFVDESLESVRKSSTEAALTTVQLHGDESPAFCASLDLPVIKAFRVKPDETAEMLKEKMEPYRDSVQYFLLDAYRDGVPGGTGSTIDWSVAAALATEFPILLSGGLTPANISEAVETVRPLGIDLSSGVESSPGVKDFDLIADVFDVFDKVRSTQSVFTLER